MLTNSTLVEIAAPGPAEANGDPGIPEAVWTGRAKGYLKRTRRQIISGGVSVPLRRDTFTILGNVGAPVVEEAGGDWEAYTVVIVDERAPGKPKRRFTVRGMENRAAGTVADSLRLELENEVAA